MQEPLVHNKNDTNQQDVNTSKSVIDEWSTVTKEIIDALPLVWTRGLVYFIIIFAATILPWAMLSKVEETGSARGRLEPQGKTLKLDVPASGTVTAINIKEGQTVTKGQVLLKLDSDFARAELQQAQAKLEGLHNRINQLELLKNQLLVSSRTQQLQNQAQDSEQLAQLDQIQQRINSSKKVHILEKGRLFVAENDVKRHKYLLQQGAISKSKLEEIQGTMLERKSLLEQAKSDIEQATTEITKQRSTNQRNKRTGELAILEIQKQVKELQSQRIDVQSEIVQTQKQIVSLQLQMQQRILVAPTDGTIFQLSVNHAGTVLQPGQTVAQVAPKKVPLIFRAEIPSQESGFLRVGMPVKLKFDAYPFQEYGVLEGNLRWISPDSKIVETPQGKQENYELEIMLNQTYIQNQNKRVPLTPGQTATAEVIVRRRRIIDFLLDPFKKLHADGLKL